MSNAAIELSVELTTVNCGECGGVYAVNSRFHTQRREKGGYWTCPYCKTSWGFNPDGAENARLKKELQAEKDRKLAALAEANEARAALERQRKESARVARRVKHGVCTCCNRTFQNLARHMKTKHPSA